MVKPRNEVSQNDQWNVEALYPSFEKWQEGLNAVGRQESPHWPELEAYKDKLGESPETLKKAIETLLSISRNLMTLYTYAHLRHDEEITHDVNKVAYNQILSLLHDFAQESAWFEPELLALPDASIQAYLASPVLTDYRFHIEKIVRVKKHMLSIENEELMALAGKALQAPNKAFSAINDADFKFGSITDKTGKPRELSHALYGIYIRDQDRTLRENAFKQMQGKYLEYENTLCELLNGQIQSHVFNARARHYSSCLEAALFPKNIDTQVYHALIKAVHSKMSSLHKYIKLRKRVLGLDELHLYDMYVPFTPNVDIKMDL